jgi:FKBP-type peptidyl-prolyl cis-trans isomerase FklB
MKYFVLVLAMLVSYNLIAQNPKGKEKETEKEKIKEVPILTELDRVSYSLGINIGQNIKKQGLDTVNLEALFKAIEDVFAKSDLKISPEKANQMIIDYIQKQKTGQTEEKIDLQAKKNEANDFMLRNKTENNIVQLPSGVQYKIVRESTGNKPKSSDKVIVQYHASLIDGTEFDSSHGKQVSEKVSKFVPGLREAIQQMPAGSKWKVFVPYQLGFGEKGNSELVGPYETLIYVIELISISQ